MMKIFDLFSVERVENCPQGTGANCFTNLPQAPANDDQLKILFALWFGIAVGLAIITILVAAFNFATAATDADKISRAKKSVVLALIGLFLSISAEVIVMTLLGRL